MRINDSIDILQCLLRRSYGVQCDRICIFFNQSCSNLIKLSPPGINLVIIKIRWAVYVHPTGSGKKCTIFGHTRGVPYFKGKLNIYGFREQPGGDVTELKNSTHPYF